MIKKKFNFLILILLFNYIKSEDFKLTDDLVLSPVQNLQNLDDSLNIGENKKVKKIKPGKKNIPFSFENKNLVELINDLAAVKEVNVIFPQAASDMDTIRQQKITYKPDEDIKIPVEEAWNIIKMYLELSGFSLYQKKENLYAITTVGKKGDSGITREPLDLYSGVNPVDLPRTDSRIVYIYYFRNLKVPEKDGSPDPIGTIIKDMSSLGAPEPLYLTRSNGIVIVDKADAIAAMITLLSELDHTGYKEVIEVVPLNYISADDVAKIFDTLKKAVGEENISPFLRTDTKVNSISYFAADTKIVPDRRNNQLILMGRESAVVRITDFIHNNLDMPIDSGDSILHHYDLQYLNAEQFAPVLQSMLDQKDSQASQGQKSSPERFFEGIVVAAEKIVQVKQNFTTEAIKEIKGETLTAEGIKGTTTLGGNRLIIAAMQDDWLRLKDLIYQLDKPEPQVILEVLIVDFTQVESKELSTTLRNKTSFNINDNPGLQFLSSQISAPGGVLCPNPTKLAQDLLSLCTPGNTTTLASSINNGALLISFNDPQTPGIFGLIKLLDKFTTANILSHPYLISTNNQRATITSSLIKRGPANAIGGSGGVTTVQIIDIPASIQVQMIPRLSSLDRLSLQIGIDINDFADPNSPNLTRITRRVETYANMNSGEILVIGGVNSQANTDVRTGTPVLSKIPLIGWLFKGKAKTITNGNVVVFISPTIVHTKLRDGLDLYTRDKIAKGRRDLDDEIVFGDSMKDPINRLFFGNGKIRNDELIMEYLSDTKNSPDYEQIKTGKEKKLEKKQNVKKIVEGKRQTKKIKLQDIPA